MARTAKQRAALRKAQLASARKRRRRGTPAQRKRKYKRAASLGGKIILGTATASLVAAHFKAGGKVRVHRNQFRHQADTPLRVFKGRTLLGRSHTVGYQKGNRHVEVVYSTRRQRDRAGVAAQRVKRATGR